ncbi:Threonine dehydratase, mitochondrial [Zancudomyces culisetae]|uniref:Threonine dehydratase n=1 Tax=Zancudomyces culisetae TaxID=1213189 RepID=A0A1R1PW96_ZANCU|nr:Threonine dehydratase, mitochondrial [Zancudomyces culisetae]OMH85241.1 Threonine dehydratase, mitochondrial [Zancudomyces culisetae]|eukprot:OMH78537.1 Threonine dehydratase, mitochondrial [Zancudomyces culisetae]
MDTSKTNGKNAELKAQLLDKVEESLNVLKTGNDYLSMILTANVYDAAVETPLTPAVNLSSKLNNNILLKREDLQPIFSFKIRGAYNKLSNLTEEEKSRGVIACSAAMAAQSLGIKATIVMPVSTPEIKWKNVQRMGGTVVLHGEDFDSAKMECERLAKEKGYVNIHPFDDPYVIAGQGTIGVEILRQAKPQEIYAIFAAVGGGGLIAGIAAYIKRICPHIKVIGVEAIDSDAMHQALESGYNKLIGEVGLFAEGAAVRQVGAETYRVASEYVDEIVLVTNDEICSAIKDVFDDTRSVLEPAGALGVAGMKKYAQMNDLKNKTLISVASGANINFNRLRFVAERAEVGEGSEAMLSVMVPELPGSFYRLYQIIHPRNVTEFSYRYSDPKIGRIFMAFNLQDRTAELPKLLQEMKNEGFQPMDISDNEFAKDHARYMIGGRSEVSHEHLISFTFPERPGALYRFLSGMRLNWNISLFHYRNYGHDFAKVLVGIQVPPDSTTNFQTIDELPPSLVNYLENLKYRYKIETQNPIYQSHFRC